MSLDYDAGKIHSVSFEKAIKIFESNAQSGLLANEAKTRLEQFGKNSIEQKKKIDPIKIFISQFNSFVIYILFAAAIISYLINEPLDSIVILVIVVLNAGFGFIQEYKAEKSIEALKKLAALRANVIRGGEEREIDAQELVPGDIILLDTGMKVPADARIINCAVLQVDESMMTGESVPSKKSEEEIKQTSSIAEQSNMLFMGTVITKGRAKALVVSTGMRTQMGSIATMIEEQGEKLTPLQIKLNEFGKKIGIATLVICAFIFVFAYTRDYLTLGSVSFEAMGILFLAAVALAVAAIPEGLPAIVTITLGIGIQKMARKNALVRRLASVETLGSCDVICTDKTGTLTTNQMTVRRACTIDNCVDISGEGYEPQGKINYTTKVAKNQMKLLFEIGALCNDARLLKDKKYEIKGDPTEGALIVSGAKAGISKISLEKKYPRVYEIPFDTQRKKMTTVHKDGKKLLAYTKGAPDVILSKCSHILIGGKKVVLTSANRKKVLEQNTKMASSALRVLGFSYKEVKRSQSDSVMESGQIFVGLQGMIDPPRPEVRAAIEMCRNAGIRTVMITGDFKDTAIAIARELGIFSERDIAIDGHELSRMNDEELYSKIDDIVIFARASSEHKARILTALKKKGHTVAMTGDGINDAPAIKNADIGIAMGLSGTDVAKEASDMILTDDNFASIAGAVEQGRHIYNSIQQFVQYTLSSNLGEILAIFIALSLGWPLPLIAIQILWINLLTDGLPGLALGLDPDSSNVMAKPPRKKSEGILSAAVVSKILFVGSIIGAVTLLVFNYYGREGALAVSAAFTTLIMAQMFHILTYRMGGFKLNILANKYLIGAIALTIFLQLLVIYSPLNVVFKTTAMPLEMWVVILLASSSAYIIPEIAGAIIRFFTSVPIRSQKA